MKIVVLQSFRSQSDVSVRHNIEFDNGVVLSLDGGVIRITRGISELESYLLEDVDSQAKILRYAVLLLEKTWVDKRLVLAFIEIAANGNNITHR
ncbi:MAG: hypothetical protein ACI91R_001952 [Vicingaceae bacterium]